jgi:hypothetical protein
MTDITLYHSTCLNGIIILTALVYGYIYETIPRYLIAMIAMVLLTSLLNHNGSNPIMKWCDRVLSTITIIGLAHYIWRTSRHKLALFSLLVSIIAFYLLAKYLKIRGDSRYIYAHSLVHIFATCLVVFFAIDN